VLARIIGPTSKQDLLRVLAEAGIEAPAYRTLTRGLPEYATDAWRDRLAKACAQRAAWGPAFLVLYDVSTLYIDYPAKGYSLSPATAMGPPVCHKVGTTSRSRAVC